MSNIVIPVFSSHVWTADRGRLSYAMSLACWGGRGRRISNVEGREEGLENAGAGFKNPEGGGRRTHLGSGLPVAYQWLTQRLTQWLTSQI